MSNSSSGSTHATRWSAGCHTRRRVEPGRPGVLERRLSSRSDRLGREGFRVTPANGTLKLTSDRLIARFARSYLIRSQLS